MRLSLSLLLGLPAVTPVLAIVPPTSQHRETIQEAAYHARDLVIRRSDGLATFMSVFPEGYGDGLDGMPIGGMEYVAPADNGDLYILAMPLSKQIHNVLTSPTHNATLAIKDEKSERKCHQIGGTDRNRMTLFGYLEIIESEKEQNLASKVFGKYHKDAKAYYPGKGPHKALWSRFVVERIYWIGGFGDTHFIGWIPIDLYRDPRKHDIVSEDFGGSKLLTQLGHLFD